MTGCATPKDPGQGKKTYVHNIWNKLPPQIVRNRNFIHYKTVIKSNLPTPRPLQDAVRLGRRRGGQRDPRV